MGREKRKLPKAAVGGSKERHKRNSRFQYDPGAPVPEGLVARLPPPKTTGKHHSYFELVENMDKKKKKLDFKVTNDQKPPPGFAFVPIGNPNLTTACKELSREKDAMIFIVSTATKKDPTTLSHHIHRTGHHVREAILVEAKSSLSHLPQPIGTASDGMPEPLPENQTEYTAQVNSVIRDLFPRIPHIDRQEIIVQSFNLSEKHRVPKPVGLVEDVPLSRRVQLAVLAHIRHKHTRYDQLLRETKWETARKVVECLCLDILVKWRGDEETGRDQIDEILREVVVISDSEDEDEDDDAESVEKLAVSSSHAGHVNEQPGYDPAVEHSDQRTSYHLAGTQVPRNAYADHGEAASGPSAERITSRRVERGFRRYRAWEEAIRRNRGDGYGAKASDLIAAGPGQSLGVQVAPQDSQAVNRPGGTVPYSNGFVPPHSRRSDAPLAYGGSLPVPSTTVSNGQVLPAVDTQAPWTPLERRVSPVTHRLQDMLVQSIEPVSPGVPNNYSSGRPQATLAETSSTRYGMPYRPEQALPVHDSRRWNVPVHAERVLANERQPPGVLPGGNHRGSVYPVDHNPIHNHPPHYSDLDTARLRSPLSFSQPEVTGSVPSVPSRTIIVDAPRPGERSNPVYMEDRGGFFERVHPPANGTGYQIVRDQGRPEPWPSHTPGRLHDAPRDMQWEDRPGIIGSRRLDQPFEIMPTHTIYSIPREPHSTMQGASHYVMQQVAQPARTHHAVYSGPAQDGPGYRTVVPTAARMTMLEHHPVTDIQRQHESLQHTQQPVYRHYPTDQIMAEGRQYLGSPGRQGHVVVLE